MNKEELVERIATKTGLTKKDAMDAVNTTLDTVA
ncbi:MAG TPA: HU family DNA-binding protein, partial [bacterium]|nr:HU family DNA-binding protein [bacterium]